MVSEVQVEIDKHQGVSFLPHYLCSLLMVSEGQVEIDKHLGVSFFPHYVWQRQRQRQKSYLDSIRIFAILAMFG